MHCWLVAGCLLAWIAGCDLLAVVAGWLFIQKRGRAFGSRSEWLAILSLRSCAFLWWQTRVKTTNDNKRGTEGGHGYVWRQLCSTMNGNAPLWPSSLNTEYTAHTTARARQPAVAVKFSWKYKNSQLLACGRWQRSGIIFIDPRESGFANGKDNVLTGEIEGMMIRIAFRLHYWGYGRCEEGSIDR